MGKVMRPEDLTPRERLRSLGTTLRAVPRTLSLVWSAHRGLSLAMAALNATQGLQPVAHAWLSKLLIDAVTAGLAGAPPPAVPWSEPFVPVAAALGLEGVALA